MSDMKHNLLFLCAAALVLAACTKDEPTDGTRLLEGQYPLEIAAVTLGVEGGEAQPWGAPQTRVSENADGTGSVFDMNNQFSVQIEGDTQTAIYTVQGATATTTPSMPGIPPRTAPSTSATKTTALPTCCTARERATTRPRSS